MKAKAKAVAIPPGKRLPGAGRNTHNPASNPGSALKLAARLREKQACELRLNGRSYKEIGARLAITDMGAYKIIMRCLERELTDIRERIPAMRKIELNRCDKMLKAISGRVNRGDLKAITVALKIAERRARLAGLDSPVDVKLTGTGEGGAVSIEVFRRMVDDAKVETDAIEGPRIIEIERVPQPVPEIEPVPPDIPVPAGQKPI
jgi:hypothetical protein